MDTLPTRFASRIHADPEGCWLWTGPTDSHGYAQTRRDGLIHRATYVEAKGPIPHTLELDHLCRVRHCVNPNHLEPVTHRENVLRGDGIAAIAAQATHCPAGHPYAGRNLVIFADGKRRCRACRLERDKEWKKKARRERHGHLGSSSTPV